jgi:hypothetical protein
MGSDEYFDTAEAFRGSTAGLGGGRREETSRADCSKEEAAVYATEIKREASDHLELCRPAKRTTYYPSETKFLKGTQHCRQRLPHRCCQYIVSLHFFKGVAPTQTTYYTQDSKDTNERKAQPSAYARSRKRVSVYPYYEKRKSFWECAFQLRANTLLAYGVDFSAG